MSSVLTTVTPNVADRTIGQPARERPTELETRVFLSCCGVIAIHLVVDAYIDVRPGTSPTDHVISGTVPVAAIAALAYWFGRARAGTAAAIAILLGLTTAIAAIGPLGPLVVDGHVAPGQITGALGLAAGVILVGLGGTMLWRTRRIDGSRRRRLARRAGRAVLGLAFLHLIAAPVGVGYTNANTTVGYALDEVELGPDFQRIELETADGVRVAAAYRPSSNGAAVIAFPGRLADHTELLARHGYGVLVMTPRGRDSSEGDPPFVWKGEEDLRAAVRYLQSRPDVETGRIGGLGISHGGLLMIQTAASEPGLRAVVSEGGSKRRFGDDLHLLIDPLLPAVNASPVLTVAMAVFSDSLPPPTIDELIAEIAPRPIMLIWAEGIEFPNEHYFEQAGEPKTIWAVPDSDHGGGIHARPEEYELRVIGFFDDALLRAEP